MSFEVYYHPQFKKELKQLSTKHHSIKLDVAQLIDNLEAYPKSGVEIAPDVYKIRLAITSKGRGKSGGGRVVTYVVTEDQEVWLLSIYDKADRENIRDKDVASLVASVMEMKRETNT